jgi:hypothetical protein
MARHAFTSILATLLLGAAVASAREAPSGVFRAHELRLPAGSGPARDEPLEPLVVASLDPIAEHASVAPRPELLRQLPGTPAPGGDLSARRGDLLAPPRRPVVGSGCAQVARWCLAHATSTSTP